MSSQSPSEMLLILWFLESFCGTLLLGLGLIYFLTPERGIFLQYLYSLFCTPTSIFDPIPYIAWLFGVLMTATFVLWSPNPTPGDDTAWMGVLYSPLFALAFQDWLILIPVAILLLLTLVTVSQNYVGLFIEPFLVIPTSTMPLPRILELTMAGMRSSYVVECGARCVTAATESSLEARDECLGLGGVGVVCAGLRAHEGERGAVKALALSIISLTYGSYEGCSQVQREGGVASLLTLIQHHWGDKEVVRTCLWALASASGVGDSGIKGEGPLRLLIQCLHHGLDTREARTARMGAWALSNALRGSASNRRLFCMGLGGVRVLLQALKRGVGGEAWEEGWGEILEAINRALAMALGGFTETEMEGVEVEVEGKVEDEGGGVGEVAHQQLVDEGGIEAILQGLLEHCGGGNSLPFIIPPPPQTLPPATDDDAVDTEEWVLNNGEGVVKRGREGDVVGGAGAGAGAAPLPPTTTGTTTTTVTTTHMRPGAVEWFANILGALCCPLSHPPHHRAAGATHARAHRLISLGGIGILLQALEALVHFPPTMPVIPAQATILALLRVITAAAGGASEEGLEGMGGGGDSSRNVAQDIAMAAGAIPLLVTFYAATECPITRRCLMTLGYLPDGNLAPSQPALLLLRLEKDARDARLKSCLECWKGGVACPGKAGGHSVERQCAICMGGGGGAISVGASNSSSSSSSNGNSNGVGNGNGDGNGNGSSNSPPPSVVHPNTHQNRGGDIGSSSRGSREWEVLPCGHAFHFACIMSWAAHESRVGEGEGGGGGDDGGGGGGGAGARLSGVVHCPVDRCVVSRVGSGDPRVIGAGELPVATPRWGVGGSSSSLLSSNSGVGGFK